jgi:hypothetical protein
MLVHGHLRGLLRSLAASAPGPGAGAGGQAWLCRLLGVRRWQWAAAKQWSDGGHVWCHGGVGCAPHVTCRIARAWAWRWVLAVLIVRWCIMPQVCACCGDDGRSVCAHSVWLVLSSLYTQVAWGLHSNMRVHIRMFCLACCQCPCMCGPVCCIVYGTVAVAEPCSK